MLVGQPEHLWFVLCAQQSRWPQIEKKKNIQKQTKNTHHTPPEHGKPVWHRLEAQNRSLQSLPHVPDPVAARV
jgi:hypothetical protein